jgi:hypothetical protein
MAHSVLFVGILVCLLVATAHGFQQWTILRRCMRVSRHNTQQLHAEVTVKVGVDASCVPRHSRVSSSQPFVVCLPTWSPPQPTNMHPFRTSTTTKRSKLRVDLP